MLAPLLFNIFFAAVIHVAYTHFEADKDIIDALVGLRKKTGARGLGRITAGESVPSTSLWGMLYADDAGVVSQSPEQLRKMMVVIVTVCAAFVTPFRRPRLRSCVCAHGHDHYHHLPELLRRLRDDSGIVSV